MLLLKTPSRSRIERQAIIHGTAQILFAADVTLCSLNGCVSKKKLDLFQFAARSVAQTGARPSQVMRGKRLEVGSLRAGLNNVPNDILRDAVAPNHAVLADRPEQLTADDGNALCPCVERVLDPDGNGNRPHTAGLADQVHNRPVILATLDRLPFEAYDLRAPQTAAQQERDY